MILIAIPLALAIKLIVFLVFHIYRFSLSFIGFEELFRISIACIFGSFTLAAVIFLFNTWLSLSGFPRSVIIIDFAFTAIGIILIRISKRTYLYLRSKRKEDNSRPRAIIVGAGDAGEILLKSLRKEQKKTYFPVCFLDDDPIKQGITIHGIPVIGPRSNLPNIIHTHKIDSVLIAMPSAPSQIIRETVDYSRKGGVSDIKIVPFLSELYSGEFRASDIREIKPEDVLKRDPVSIDFESVKHIIHGKKILVTGASGSIGSELCRQILRFSPAVLLALDFDETGLFNLDNDIRKKFPDKNFKIIIGNIRDKAKIHNIFQKERPEVVFHAAAYKHVPMMEAYPEEAVKTNIFGTESIIDAALQVGVKAFVLISTDKAVNPVSVMGMTKRMAEIVSLAMNDGTSMRCIAVRFGNVLGSRGSVIPTFMEQIRLGGPVTVTHPDMTRYFMTIPEAVLLVLQAATMGKGGEVFLLDMGKPVRILDIARDLIRFHNLEPDEDIPIVFTGIRPGEKMEEELLTAAEGADATSHEKIFIAKMENRLPREMLHQKLQDLKALTDQGNGKSIKDYMMFTIQESERAE
ncbi:polysaccharide biosynthesis protein [Methanospirillum sp.]